MAQFRHSKHDINRLVLAKVALVFWKARLANVMRSSARGRQRECCGFMYVNMPKIRFHKFMVYTSQTAGWII